MGLSFAIPIDVAIGVSDQLREQGFVVRGWLGVLIQDVTRELAESFGMDQPQGALIAKVLADSPAEKAGLKVGDIVVKYEGQQVTYSSDLPPLVGQTKVGHEAKLSVLRGSKEKMIQVTIEALPDQQQPPKLGSKKPGETRLGIAVVDLTDAQREGMGVDGGVLVQQVGAGAGADAGIRRGDVIVNIDNKPVSSASKFRKLVAQMDDGAVVPVLVHRRQGPVFLAIRIPE
ncbi:MAG: PDZ domain-containing protein [Immundisolibacteraceae bacterium]|nr:PDZ domain-containing protein [Immundisolibacteraceae bacterium]